MNSVESARLLLAVSGADTVKLFDTSVMPQYPCVLTYTPSPGLRVNSVKWNHNNLVLASAGEDCKISLWRKNGQSLWSVHDENSRGVIVEPSESISTISFSNKGSRYLCSGGTGKVVQIWDLQNKRCVKWLKGHSDTITGVMYNCKDEHIASVSRNGDLILHNLSSGTKAAELRDPNGQVLGALDYSRLSRHLLVTAGDDGSIHQWDTTGRSPKASWLKQHSAPTSAVSFSPSNDKIIASVGLDMKLYTFDTGSRKPSHCIHYEAPFSSLAFTDDGLTLAAGTSTGQVVFYDIRGKPQPITVLHAYGFSEPVTNICWQRSKPAMANEHNHTEETVLMAGDVGDSILMPDPLPSRASSSHSMPSVFSGSRNPSCLGASEDLLSFPAGSASSGISLPASKETPDQSSLLTGVTLPRLHALRSNFKDDMDIFSPLVEVQPVTPTLDKLWDTHDGGKKLLDRKLSFLYTYQRSGPSEEGSNDSHPVFDWKSNSSTKQDDISSTVSQLTSTPAASTTCTENYSSSITPPEAWGVERLSNKFSHHRQMINKLSRFATLASTTSSSSTLMLSGLQESVPTYQSTSSSMYGLSLANLRTRVNETLLGSSEAVSSPLGTKSTTPHAEVDNLGPELSLPRRFSSYAEKIGASPSFSDASPSPVGSPKSKKTGAETREELLKSLLSKSDMTSANGTSVLTSPNGGAAQLQKGPTLQSDTQEGNFFGLELFQRQLEETLASFQKSIHDDMHNLHIEILRQFHMQEMETSSAMKVVLDNQAEIMKELQSLRNETQQLTQLL